MQRTILHKIIPDAENHLLNLYFRLYLKAFTSHMRRQGFFFTLDYSYNMSYLNRQVLSFDAIFNNADATDAKPDFNKIKLNLDETAVELAFQEVNTATRRKLEGTTKELIPLLKEIHNTPWVEFKKLPLFTADKTKSKTAHIQDSGEGMQAFKTVIGMKLDSKYSQEHNYAPLLFVYIAEALGGELLQVLRKKYPCALQNSNNMYENDTAFRLYTINFAHREERGDIAKYIQQQLVKLNSKAFIDSLIRYIQNDFQQSILSELLYRQHFRETKIIAGTEAWRVFTTEENIKDLLAHTQLAVNDLVGEVGLEKPISDYLFKEK